MLMRVHLAYTNVECTVYNIWNKCNTIVHRRCLAIWRFCTRARTKWACFLVLSTHTKRELATNGFNEVTTITNFAWKGGWPPRGVAKPAKIIGDLNALAVAVFQLMLVRFDLGWQFLLRTMQFFALSLPPRRHNKHTSDAQIDVSALCNRPSDLAHIYGHNKSRRWTKHFEEAPIWCVCVCVASNNW